MSRPDIIQRFKHFADKNGNQSAEDALADGKNSRPITIIGKWMEDGGLFLLPKATLSELTKMGVFTQTALRRSPHACIARKGAAGHRKRALPHDLYARSF
jgi:hypothetical protein